MAFVGWVALGVGALLGHTVANGEETVSSCVDLKNVIENDPSHGEEVVVRLEGPVICNETISILSTQLVRVLGQDESRTTVSLNASAIWRKYMIGVEGELFENSGTLHLEQLEFDLDYIDTATRYGSRIVKNNGGNVTVVDCGFEGVDSSNTGQTFMMGQAVSVWLAIRSGKPRYAAHVDDLLCSRGKRFEGCCQVSHDIS